MILRGCEGIYRQHERTLSAGGTPCGIHSLTRLLGGAVAQRNGRCGRSERSRVAKKNQETGFPNYRVFILVARISKCDFWNPGEILDLYR